MRALAIALAVTLASVAQAQDVRNVVGAASYRERMALPPDAELSVELSGFLGTPVGTLAERADGRQVPLPFSVPIPGGIGADAVVSISVDATVRWRSAPIRIAPGAGDAELGLVMLEGVSSPDLEGRLICGDEQFRVGFREQKALLETGDGVLGLSVTVSASGARYVSADGSTVLWSKGERAWLTLSGRELPGCALVLEKDPPRWTAQGNEPGWRAVVEADRLSLGLDYGESRLDLRLPAPEIAAGAYRYAFPRLGLELTVREKLCQDDMSGRLYPHEVEVGTATGMLRGCGGDTMDLLTGREWTVVAVRGAPRPADARELTIEIGENEQISGSSGCNRYMGRFSVGGEGELTVGPLAATSMMCGEEVMERERAFLDALSSSERFELDEDGILRLMEGEKELVQARR